ncbi:predicted protein [Fibroporia radiculosa]|uniref:Uncharacterized protein n=1 Tax=Fibroporia radiculosa TaxID=599839 RepID=J7SCZ9_9APHY|nr:predicted protein [Fibroporia radiculosa]
MKRLMVMKHQRIKAVTLLSV